MTDPLVADSAAQALVDALREGGQTVATAESLTAGLLSATIAGVPGASTVLRGGVVVYATDLKSTLGGVDPDALATDGPVAARTARALALAVARNADADWGVSLTGVAGPDPQDGHAPGTVFCGIARRRSLADETVAQAWQLSGTRWEIRLTSARRALQELLTMVHADRVTKEA
ncbi:MAG TPA: CinA family protein [Gordonia sp. (in: high G+C Gram-positive bacteria)]|uniref:CinA family protein n=1 Tax=unclassified Gordonia (in: high G+C Gram-positive bacteria) TaxID=2657482 RepID=UPI000FA25835|nr:MULTISPECIES: CinA family protein [unclassified Gordonia (in: high G+C Gram-positive bacteria)]RUP38529.1 MAG: CinA family protein [Gordonia sp. (in: high G+C Gram-positive bacteria)]HNP58590.1 CinA family protein [Gordonia sp. (in: high G+C Gram-positive bacteria)]HRC52250.1 CinA family protein [Gordonia sp. (in: high G+C Gram-positive bacteria)]